MEPSWCENGNNERNQTNRRGKYSTPKLPTDAALLLDGLGSSKATYVYRISRACENVRSLPWLMPFGMYFLISISYLVFSWALPKKIRIRNLLSEAIPTIRFLLELPAGQKCMLIRKSRHRERNSDNHKLKIYKDDVLCLVGLN